MKDKTEETKSKLYIQTLIPYIPPAESNNIVDYELDEYGEMRYTDDWDDDLKHVNIISDLASVTDTESWTDFKLDQFVEAEAYKMHGIGSFNPCYSPYIKPMIITDQDVIHSNLTAPSIQNNDQ